MSPFWHKPASSSLIVASAVFAILVGDILIAKAQVMMGAINPLHLGDTMQFILLLLAVVLFVVGTVQKETLADSDSKEGQQSAGQNRRSKRWQKNSKTEET